MYNDYRLSNIFEEPVDQNRHKQHMCTEGVNSLVNIRFAFIYPEFPNSERGENITCFSLWNLIDPQIDILLDN